MKYVITIEASKTVRDVTQYAYDHEKNVRPKKHDVYSAMQTYLINNGYEVTELSVRDEDVID